MTQGFTGKLAKATLTALLLGSAGGLAWADDAHEATPVDPIPAELQNAGGSDAQGHGLVDGGLLENGNWVSVGEGGPDAPEAGTGDGPAARFSANLSMKLLKA